MTKSSNAIARCAARCSAALICVFALASSVFVLASSVFGQDWLESHPDAPSNQPTPAGLILPTQQLLTPAGRQIELPGMRPQVLALSPDGRLLVTCGLTHQLVVIDPQTGQIVQHVSLLPKAGIKLPPDISITGLTFSPDGSRLYLSDRDGDIQIFAIDEQHRVSAVGQFDLPQTGAASALHDLPAGIAASEDGRRLYVVLNISNRLVEIDAKSGRLLRSFDVGDAPFDVVLAAGKAYVSNLGGRRPTGAETDGPIGLTGKVRVDPVRFIASEGSVSVIDLQSGKPPKEIVLAPHACALAKSPDGRFVAVACAGGDCVSFIDTATDRITRTFSTRRQSANLFGASPSALAFDTSGQNLFVCNAAQNAVAVFALSAREPSFSGLIPTGWFPGAIVFDASRATIDVANIKGTGAGKRIAPNPVQEFNVHQFHGSLSIIAVPASSELATMTQTVLVNDRRRAARAALQPARPAQPARPIPQRIGEPSLFHHVIYIIKENRTYDQVLGDMPQGRGQPSLCIYGQRVTPNEHKIASLFVLLDNTNCAGSSSAEGHQWADSAFCTDYVERAWDANFFRSYPDGRSDTDVDALAYATSGFIWDNALAHGKSIRNYGEFTTSISGWSNPALKTVPTFLDYYRDFTGGTHQTRIASRASIPSLNKFLDTNTVGWDLSIPDIVRADRFIRELHACEAAGALPDLCIIWLPNDHTSATQPNAPTPAAMVADNDLAFGRIVDAVSHSRFWNDTCIFAIEDDTQDGWDHISAYRTTAFVISPFTRRAAVVHDNYSQPGLMHTIEAILGLPPMNELDAQAPVMSGCFTDKADLTPYDAAPNQVPLDLLNPPPVGIVDPQQRSFALASARLPLAAPDKCPEEVLNRILWNAAKGSQVPYPAAAAKDGDHDRDDR